MAKRFLVLDPHPGPDSLNGIIGVADSWDEVDKIAFDHGYLVDVYDTLIGTVTRLIDADTSDPIQDFGDYRLWTHHKRGGIYTKITTANLQLDGPDDEADLDVYMDVFSGKAYARKKEEFAERFSELDAEDAVVKDAMEVELLDAIFKFTEEAGYGPGMREVLSRVVSKISGEGNKE